MDKFEDFSKTAQFTDEIHRLFTHFQRLKKIPRLSQAFPDTTDPALKWLSKQWIT